MVAFREACTELAAPDADDAARGYPGGRSQVARRAPDAKPRSLPQARSKTAGQSPAPAKRTTDAKPIGRFRLAGWSQTAGRLQQRTAKCSRPDLLTEQAAADMKSPKDPWGNLPVTSP